MKIFSIDTMPLSDDILTAHDYNSKYIYSALCDPLFRYNDKTSKIEKFSCLEYSYNKNYMKLTVKLRNDLYFSDGSHVKIEDYYNTFNKILKKGSHSSILLENLKKIECHSNSLIFYLKSPNRNFHNILSVFNFTCTKNGLTSGPYYLLKRTDNEIILKRNPYYRKKITNEEHDILIYRVINLKYDLNYYISSQTNITNNTSFPYLLVNNYTSLIKKDNLISMNLCFNHKWLSKKYKSLRKIIMKTINREEINSKLNNQLYIANDFFVMNKRNDKDILNTKVKRKFDIEISLGYNDFYPNEEVAIVIKKQLESIGIRVTLIKNEFELLQKSDLNLVLNYPDYVDDSSYLLGKYFSLISDGIKYKLYVFGYNLTGKKIFINLLNNYIVKNAFKIPLIKMFSIYLCNKDLSELNFMEFNYEDL